MKSIFLFLLFSSLIFGVDFYKSENHVVDTLNNTMWQDSPNDVKVLKHQDTAVLYCEDLELDGYADWRLPTVKEFKKIIDKKRKNKEPKIVKAFQYVLLDHYWTQDRTWRNFFTWGYYVHFNTGTVYYDNKTYPKYVKCIRDGN